MLRLHYLNKRKSNHPYRITLFVACTAGHNVPNNIKHKAINANSAAWICIPNIIEWVQKDPHQFSSITIHETIKQLKKPQLRRNCVIIVRLHSQCNISTCIYAYTQTLTHARILLKLQYQISLVSTKLINSLWKVQLNHILGDLNIKIQKIEHNNKKSHGLLSSIFKIWIPDSVKSNQCNKLTSAHDTINNKQINAGR